VKAARGDLVARLRLFLATSALTFAFLLLFRLAFFLVFQGRGESVEPTELAGAAYLGAKFDLRLALLLTLPALALSWLPVLDPLRSQLAARLWRGYFLLAWAAVALVNFVDFAHYDYLQARLDASVFEHLAAPDIALAMVWESYPILLPLAGLALVVLAYAWALRRLTRSLRGRIQENRSRRARFLALGSTLLLVAGGIYGKLSFYPLRWSEAYASQQKFTTAIALNPVLQLVDTWEHRRRTFDVERARAHYTEVAAYLGVDEPDAASLNFDRDVAARPRGGSRPPNIVIVQCESLAAFKLGCLGNELDPTPRFDALARDGWLFTRFFVPSGPTARSVFSAVTSVPDVNLSNSASRNPLAVNQRSLLNEFHGYRKLYFIGGSASWGNIRGVLKHNVPDLTIHEEGDFSSPRTDVWGISDLDLVREANAVLRATQTPFVAFIQTAGNHSPWTIPEEHGDFELVSGLADDALRDAGFPELIEHYNAVRFLDHSLGEFIELARGEDYFEDTLFFFYGDHGTAFPARTATFPGLTGHHVPLLVYGPALLGSPRVIETVASSLDLLPTAAGLAGLSYRNSSLGRDLFDDSRARPPYAFLRIGDDGSLVGPEFLLETLPDGTRKLFAYASDSPLEDLAERRPDVVREMGSLATGLFETASWMLYRDNLRAD
jgi:phosphoglycerol transferase MdoB-like AlkP superfamily enzyme